jgi:hypothetical protein
VTASLLTSGTIVRPRLSFVPSPASPPAADLAPTSAADPERGARSPWLLAALLLLAFAAGASMPLADPDLGLHLRLGEWIATRGLPRVEPFAWTRAGAPFYAYSWLAEVAYFRVLSAAGPWGLHALHGLVVAAAAAAADRFTREARVAPFAAHLLVVAHVAASLAIVTGLRPQGVLFVAMPLCWAAAARLARPDGRPSPWPYATLWAATALAANTHLLAPMCAGALALLVPGRAVRWRTTAAAAAVVGVGLLSTPYALDWAAVLRLNFAPNLLFKFPSPIIEHLPGFRWVTDSPGLTTVVALGLTALPWALPGERFRPPVRAALAALWIAGAALFAIAAKGLLVWWLVALPLAAATFDRLPTPSGDLVGRALRALPGALLLVLVLRGMRDTALTRAFEGDAVTRSLAIRASLGAMAVADSLDRIAPRRTGRVLTDFNYGNALTWRLPTYSMSIDGRTIFPDSAAAYDAWTYTETAPDSVPWVAGSADVAVLPYGSASDRRLARTSGWRRLAVARVRLRGQPFDSASLWARDAWLGRDDRAK